MNYSGWAFRKDESEKRKEISERYQEIKHLRKDFKWSVNSCYAHNKFTAEPLTDEAKNLSSFEVLILADDGNLCFGGDCSQSNGVFSGRYNTD
ncbi:hypothetical protein Arno162_130 [Pectobacterium phage Arno162]|uniref:Uncharacterized protein n=1 Tax=Pectobacterium phage Arno162 TaxID=2500577 RepID=A0A678ZSC6_9CAUD|nr:hypothetical protein Arno162_130 [Pectobacterium phage Arno162]